MKKETKQYLIEVFFNVKFYQVIIIFVMFLTVARMGKTLSAPTIYHWVTWILIITFMLSYQIDKWIESHNQHSCTAEQEEIK